RHRQRVRAGHHGRAEATATEPTTTFTTLRRLDGQGSWATPPQGPGHPVHAHLGGPGRIGVDGVARRARDHEPRTRPPAPADSAGAAAPAAPATRTTRFRTARGRRRVRPCLQVV